MLKKGEKEKDLKKKKKKHRALARETPTLHSTRFFERSYPSSLRRSWIKVEILSMSSRGFDHLKRDNHFYETILHHTFGFWVYFWQSGMGVAGERICCIAK